MSEPSPRWNTATKRTVVLVILVLVALIVYRFRAIIPPIAIALFLAFIVDPAVAFLMKRFRITRTAAATTVILSLVVLILGGVVAAPVTAVSSIQRVIKDIQVDTNEIIGEVGDFLERPLQVGVYTIELGPVYEDLTGKLTGFVGSVAQATIDVVVGVASGAVWGIFVLLATFYFVRDGPKLIKQLDKLAPKGYLEDFIRLRHQVTQVWNAFLRGQLLLCVVIALITTVMAMIVGLPYAPALGLIAGLLEIVPNIGPILAAVPAVILALISGSSILPLGNFWFAGLVAALYVLIQQVENSFLVPRILGRNLNMHPLLVLVGAIVGASLAGILGMFMAAPVLATLLVIMRYVFSRLYDGDPFAEPELETESPASASDPGLLHQAGEAALRRLQDKVKEVSRRSENETEVATERDSLE